MHIKHFYSFVAVQQITYPLSDDLREQSFSYSAASVSRQCSVLNNQLHRHLLIWFISNHRITCGYTIAVCKERTTYNPLCST